MHISINISNFTNHNDRRVGYSLWMTGDSPTAVHVGFVVDRAALNRFLSVQLFYPINFDIIGALSSFICPLGYGCWKL
jgi:hypothetical protein